MKLKSIYFFIALFVITINYTKAQEILCGKDTVTFDLDNYQIGSVQWQESLDGVNFTDILNECDLTLKYFTNDEKYIRAKITLSNCDQVISQAAFI